MKRNLKLKAFFIKIFAILIIVGMTDSAVFSQTRIRFARGRTSATVSGNLSGGASKSYILGASRGQTMSVRITGGNGFRFDIGGNDVGRSTSIELRSTDDYIITVHNDGGNSNKFSLTVSIR